MATTKREFHKLARAEQERCEQMARDLRQRVGDSLTQAEYWEGQAEAARTLAIRLDYEASADERAAASAALCAAPDSV